MGMRADGGTDVRVSVGRDHAQDAAPRGVRPQEATPAAAALAPVQGGLVLIPHDDVSTDAIWPASLTYKDDVSPEEMRRALFSNFEPRFGAIARDGDILVAGRNFGCGSSREQAVTALRAFGIRGVVAGSIARTFRRNAYNNGFPVVECAALVTTLVESVAPPVGVRVLRPGVELTIDLGNAEIRTDRLAVPIAPLSDVEARLLGAGGLGPLVQAVLAGNAALA
jgi:3-isopropylmalate dehydratase small subunit